MKKILHRTGDPLSASMRYFSRLDLHVCMRLIHCFFPSSLENGMLTDGITLIYIHSFAWEKLLGKRLSNRSVLNVSYTNREIVILWKLLKSSSLCSILLFRKETWAHSFVFALTGRKTV